MKSFRLRDCAEHRRLRFHAVLEFNHLRVIPEVGVSHLRSIICESPGEVTHLNADKGLRFDAQ